MKRKIILILLLSALAGLGGWYGRQRHYESTHVFVGEAAYDRDARFLDLRGQDISAEHYEQLHRELPFCDILWDVPFQGKACSSDVKTISVEHLTMEDVEALDYFTALQSVDAADCQDYEALTALEQRRPECRVSYQIAVGEQLVDRAATALTIPRGVESLENLKYLPALEQVDLPDTDQPAGVLRELAEAYPDISFTWTREVLGKLYPHTVTEFDFSTTPLSSVEKLEEDMAYFPHLETLTLIDCGLDNEALAAFRDRVRDQYKVIWTVRIGKITIRTDATTLMPFQYGYSGEGSNKLKDSECGAMKYLEDMVCMDLGHMAVVDISFVKFMPNLEYFLVCDNLISDISPLAGAQKLKFLEVFNNDITDISALAQCPTLEDVNMCYNAIPDVSPLYALSNLNNIWLSGMYLDETQMEELRQAHPEAHIEFFVPGSVGKGWRKLPNYYAQRDMLGMWYLD